MAKTLKNWRPLVEGDVVDVIAPGYRADDSELENGILFLRKWGLEPRASVNIFARDLLCANSDTERFAQLRNALTASDSKAIWCVRGGYGSNRLIPKLAKLRRPVGGAKLLIGLSDITSLHVFLNQKWGWPTVHGPLLDRLGKNAVLPKYEKELKSFIFGRLPEIRFRNLQPLNDLARQAKTLHGPVSGGNLTVLQSSLMTAAAWNTTGRILFFEDIGERGYRIDRILEQFKQAGLFVGAKAIVFGQFTGGKEADGQSLVPAVLKRFAKTARLPVLKGLASGHDLIQRPLPFETPSTLHLGPQGELICQSGGSF